MTTAQVLFAVALGVVTLVVTLFGLYVVSSTMWADRWVRVRGREPRR
ncbi:MAG: hypothetical protein ABIW46_03940 [Acidimicrobiales bacterium]